MFHVIRLLAAIGHGSRVASYALAVIAVALSVPPAAKVVAIAATVYAVMQALKKVAVLTPYLKGWVAVAANVVFSAAGLLYAIPADQLYTVNTLVLLITAIGTAAGIHGTVKNLTAPQ